MGHAFCLRVVLMGLLAFSLMGGMFASEEDDGPRYSSEKEKAEANPLPGDLGQETLPNNLLATYPKEHQDAYRNILLTKCTKCHNAARSLNSQFFEPLGKTDEKQANLAALRASDPDVFTDKSVWQPEVDIWQRYVKRMISKPGCDISVEEGKAVYRFLVYDSNQRKVGPRKAAWKAQRQKLLADFKAKHPARFNELYGGKN